tara:strand:- start:196 stop:321 length:126 start_codon:yes stop_codon:yes gene_type:complete
MREWYDNQKKSASNLEKKVVLAKDANYPAKKSMWTTYAGGN